MRRIFVALFLVIAVATPSCAIGGDQKNSSSRNDGRRFELDYVGVRRDGRILLAGLARRGDPDDECGEEGRAMSDFVVVHLSVAGRVLADYSASEKDMGGCAVDLSDAALDTRGGLLVNGVIRDPPGFLKGGPEERERGFRARFGPSGPLEKVYDDDKKTPQLEFTSSEAELARVRTRRGGWAAIEKDPSRRRRDAEGAYAGTVVLARYARRPGASKALRLWSVPIRAISPEVDLFNDDAVGWELFFDSRRGFYGFVRYPLFSGHPEFILFKHRLDGRPDGSFGDGGRVRVEPPGTAEGSFDTIRAARAPDGDVLALGFLTRRNRVYTYLLRVEPDGRFDRSFGRVGMVELEIRDPDFDPFATLAVQPDGKIIVAGPGVRGGTPVIRLLPDGRLDHSFGRAGKVVIRTV